MRSALRALRLAAWPSLLLCFVRPSPGQAAPPSLQQARAQLAAGALDDVYLAFAPLSPGGHPEGDVPVAALLVSAARTALAQGDASLALGLSDKARALDPKSLDACFVTAEASVALDHRGAAEEALEAALALAPKNAEALFRRADFAEQEGELEKARDLFVRVPDTDARNAEAQARAARLTAELARRRDDTEAVKQIEAEQRQRQKSAAEAPSGLAATSEERIGGMVARSSRHFRIVYTEGQKDFAERAQYEQKVLDLFERAHEQVRRHLGHTPPHQVEVVCYTKDDFQLHFGGTFPSGVAGFYSGKIRMNRGEHLDDAFYATAVHEYVHAAVDALAAGRAQNVPVWLNEGLARWIERAATGGAYVSAPERLQMKAARDQGVLPSFAQLSDVGFANLGPFVGLAYAKGSAAVETLARGGAGLTRIARVIAATGGGTPFEQALDEEFGPGRLVRLDADVDALLGR